MSGSDRKDEPDEEFDFSSAEEAEGSNRIKSLEPFDQEGDEAKKGKTVKTWPDVVKDLKIEEEFSSVKRGDKSETVNSVRMFNSKTPNQLKAKRKKG